MRAQGTDQSVWRVATTHGMFNNMMIGMMLLVVGFFGCYLPKLTGNMTTLAVPALAFVGLVFLVRQPRPQLAIESDQLVYRKGRKERRFNLANLKFGYARWQVQMGGVVGTVLIVQDGDESISIGGYKFMLDDAAQYKIKDMDYCEIYIETEPKFRDFISQFNQRLGTHRPQQPQSSSQAGAPAREQAPAPLHFQLQPYGASGVQGATVFIVLGFFAATSIIPSVYFFTGPIYAGITAVAVAYILFLLIQRRKKSRNQAPLCVSVHDEFVYLSMEGAELSSVSVAELHWSAGTNRISSGSSGSSWRMPIMILQFPNYVPVTIGTMSPEVWTFEVEEVGRPQFQLGIGLWLQLARALNIKEYLK